MRFILNIFSLFFVFLGASCSVISIYISNKSLDAVVSNINVVTGLTISDYSKAEFFIALAGGLFYLLGMVISGITAFYAGYYRRYVWFILLIAGIVSCFSLPYGTFAGVIGFFLLFKLPVFKIMRSVKKVS